MKTTQQDIKTVTIHDYQSGRAIGKAQIDMAQYRLWMSGPSEVVEAHRVLNDSQINDLGIQPDTTVFVVE